VVEHFLGKEEVKGSIPFNGSKFLKQGDVVACDTYALMKNITGFKQKNNN
jgi:hypothetical protein